MKDKAISSIAKANSKAKLAREGANASRNKRGVGRRSSYSGGLSSSKGLTQFNAGGSIASSMRESSNQELSEKRQKQQQRLNKAIKVAEKIPVLNKYAKIAKAAQKVTEMKGNGGKILGGVSGGKPASGEEAEDMLAAEQRGEEYKPDQTEQKFTVFSNRQLIISAVLVCSGIFIVLILIAVITMSSITDTAGEAYLASKDNPSEEELAEAYGAQDGGGSSGSSSGSSGSVKPGSTGNLIMVGDSQFVGVCIDVYGGSDCHTIGYKKDNVTFIAKVGESFVWFKGTAVPEVKKQLNANKKSSVFINMGGNGLDDADKYAEYYNQLAKDYPDANIIAVTVGPILDEYVTYYKDINKDVNVVKFNNALKSYLSDDVIFCDVYSKVKGKVSAPGDGIHYDAKSNKLFTEEMLKCIETTDNSSSNSSFDSILSKGGTSVDKLKEKNIKQLVVVESSGSSANVSFYENGSNGWQVDSGLNASGYVGSNGTTDSPSEGKAATPKGLYGIGDAFYQNSKPDTKLGSFKITSDTYWIDDPASKYYNQHVEGTANKDWNSAEHMSEISSYKYGFVIKYNMSPIKKGAGSAIFFHISHNSPTAGCVSVSEDKVLSYLARLDKSKNPYILII